MFSCVTDDHFDSDIILARRTGQQSQDRFRAVFLCGARLDARVACRGTTMLDREFDEQRARILRELAQQADSLVRSRLLKLVECYEPIV